MPSSSITSASGAPRSASAFDNAALGEHPNGREVGAGGPQQVEPIRLGLWCCLLVGEDIALADRESTEHAP